MTADQPGVAELLAEYEYTLNKSGHSAFLMRLREALRAPVAAQPDEQTLTVGEEEDLSVGRASHKYGPASRVRPRALGAADGWQPIESAPKNRILLLGYHNEAGKWRTVRGCWVTDEELMEWENGDDFEPGWFENAVEADPEVYGNHWPITPTHWMPLPPPPDKGAV